MILQFVKKLGKSLHFVFEFQRKDGLNLETRCISAQNSEIISFAKYSPRNNLMPYYQ